MKTKLFFLLFIQFLLKIETAYCQEYQSASPEVLEALEAFLSEKDYKKSKVLFEDILKTDQNNILAINGLGLSYYRLGDIQNAIFQYDKAISLDSNFLTAFENKANALVDLGDFKMALDNINYAIERDSNNPNLYINRGRIYQADGKTLSSLDDFSLSISLGTTAPEAFVGRAILYRTMEYIDSAIFDLQYCLDNYPEYAPAYFNYGLILTEVYKDYPNALRLFQRAYELGMNDIEVLSGLGANFQLMGEYEESIANYTKAIEMDSTIADMYFNRATSYSFMEDFSSSLKDFKKALAIDANHTGSLTNRALLVYDKTENYKEAIKDLKMVIEINEKKNIVDAYAYNNLGYIQYKNGETEEGLINVQTSLKMDASNSYAYKNLALIEIKRNELENACIAAEMAIELGFIKEYGEEIISIKEKACIE